MNGLDERSVLTPEAESYLRLFGTVAPLGGAAYVAIPITTGQRFLTWFSSHGMHIREPAYIEGLRQAVIGPNCADAAPRIAALRETLQMPVIDPSSFDRPGWSQDEYRNFWAAVMRRFAAKAIFFEGWQYSSGCSFEFLTALSKGIPTLSENLRPISLAEGCTLITEAVSDYKRVNMPTSFLEAVVQRLSVNPS